MNKQEFRRPTVQAPQGRNLWSCPTGHNWEISLRTQALHASDFRSWTSCIKACQSKSALAVIKPHQRQHFWISIAFFFQLSATSACVGVCAHMSIAGSAAEGIRSGCDAIVMRNPLGYSYAKAASTCASGRVCRPQHTDAATFRCMHPDNYWD